jgi:hypothetical protein
LETSGNPSDKWGYAVQAALSLKNLPTGAGDSFNITGTFANGANRYVIGGTTGTGAGLVNFAMYGNQGLAFAGSSDAVFRGITSADVNATDLQLTTAYGVRGAFNHNWTPNWATSVFGSYTKVDYNGTASDLICSTAVKAAITAGSCNPDFAIAQVGTVTRWTPVKGLTFSGEVLYTLLDQNNSGTVTGTTPAAIKQGSIYELKDQGTFTGAVRVQRTF